MGVVFGEKFEEETAEESDGFGFGFGHLILRSVLETRIISQRKPSEWYFSRRSERRGPSTWWCDASACWHCLVQYHMPLEGMHFSPRCEKQEKHRSSHNDGRRTRVNGWLERTRWPAWSVQLARSTLPRLGRVSRWTSNGERRSLGVQDIVFSRVGSLLRGNRSRCHINN